MRKQKRNLIFFSIGACGYGLIELLWRGYTHWTMLSAGGICFMMFGRIANSMKKFSLFFKAVVGSSFITALEFVIGIIFNVILKKNVWDYSKIPFNIGGQICPQYSLLWLLLSVFCIPFASIVNKRLQNKNSVL